MHFLIFTLPICGTFGQDNSFLQCLSERWGCIQHSTTALIENAHHVLGIVSATSGFPSLNSTAVLQLLVAWNFCSVC